MGSSLSIFLSPIAVVCFSSFAFNLCVTHTHTLAHSFGIFAYIVPEYLWVAHNFRWRLQLAAACGRILYMCLINTQHTEHSCTNYSHRLTVMYPMNGILLKPSWKSDRAKNVGLTNIGWNKCANWNACNIPNIHKFGHWRGNREQELESESVGDHKNQNHWSILSSDLHLSKRTHTQRSKWLQKLFSTLVNLFECIVNAMLWRFQTEFILSIDSYTQTMLRQTISSFFNIPKSPYTENFLYLLKIIHLLLGCLFFLSH